MKIAIMADIHSNWEALEAAASYIKKEKVDGIIHLGDVVGYGANPNECFDWVQQHVDVNLMGNHEKAVITPQIREGFNPLAAEAIAWTEKVLDESYRDIIRGLPYVHVKDRLVFFHGSLDEPEMFFYLKSYEDAVASLKLLEGNIGFFGHTHIPTLIEGKSKMARHLQPGVMRLRGNEKYLINPGSIGQPRDRDPRLAFGLFDDKAYSFELIRLKYDNQTAAKKIKSVGLPTYLADRLL
ncbi:MAG: metallophosphoesterase family protein [Candidatus Omnitrophica bacterium]|nr:metallophosphoesterase family protein [Candidatus Omnitrophota bacterium]